MGTATNVTNAQPTAKPIDSRSRRRGHNKPRKAATVAPSSPQLRRYHRALSRKPHPGRWPEPFLVGWLGLGYLTTVPQWIAARPGPAGR